MHRAAIGCYVVVGLLTAQPAVAAPPITAAAIAPDAKQVVLGSQQGIELRPWPELKTTGWLKTDLSHIHDLAFSPDGQLLLAAGGAPAEEGVVELFAWPAGKRTTRVAAHKDLVYRAAWSPDGQYLATASADGTCQVFAAGTGERISRFEGHSRAVLAICYLPDGKTIASAGVDQTVQLWDALTGKHLRTLDNHVGPVVDLAVGPGPAAGASPQIVSVSEDRTVRLWQPLIGRLVRFARLPSVPRAVAWTTTDNLLVGGSDGRLCILDAETMEVVSEKRGLDGRIHTLIPDLQSSHVLLAGENGQLRRFDFSR